MGVVEGRGRGQNGRRGKGGRRVERNRGQPFQVRRLGSRRGPSTTEIPLPLHLKPRFPHAPPACTPNPASETRPLYTEGQSNQPSVTPNARHGHKTPLVSLFPQTQEAGPSAQTALLTFASNGRFVTFRPTTNFALISRPLPLQPNHNFVPRLSSGF